MSTPDVRVRLSAEGVAELVQAFQRVQKSAEAMSKGVTSGAKDMESSLAGVESFVGKVKVALGAMGVYKAVSWMKGMVMENLALAASMGKMAEKTGFAVETLSTLSFASQKYGVEQDALSVALTRLSKNLYEYGRGAKSAQDAVKSLFGDAAALRGLTQEQQIKKVIDALGGMEAGSKRTALAIELFGKSGAGLIPMLQKLSGDGFDEAARKADEFGLAIGSDMTANARQIKGQMRDLELQVKGLAFQFSAGLTPAIAESGNALKVAFKSSGVEAVRVLGNVAGEVVRFISLSVLALAKSVQLVGLELLNLASLGKDLVLNPGAVLGSIAAPKAMKDESRAELAKILKKHGDERKAINARMDADLKSVLDNLTGDSRKLAEAQRGLGKSAEELELAAAESAVKIAMAEQRRVSGMRDASAALKARADEAVKDALAALAAAQGKMAHPEFEPDESATEKVSDAERRRAEAEAKRQESEARKLAAQQRKADNALADERIDSAARVESATRKAAEAEERRRFDRGLTDLGRYYAERLRMAREQGEAETSALYSKLARLQEEPLEDGELPAEREAKVLKASSELQVKVIQNAEALKDLTEEWAREEERLQRQSLEFERLVAEAQMTRFGHARAAIAEEAAQYDELLRKQGMAAPEREMRVEAYTRSESRQVDFEELREQARSALDEIARQREQIALQVEEGLLWQFQGEEKVREMELSRLPVLAQIAAAMREAAITPEQAEDARDFGAAVQGIAVGAKNAAFDMAKFKAGVEGALTNDLSNWLSDGVTGAESLGEAFRSLASSVVASIQRIIAQMMAMAAVQKMLGILGGAAGGAAGGTGGSAGGGGADAGGIQFVASGGLVRGPGTGTSDSIAARLSDYEYVVKAAVVRQPGMLEHLNGLNFGTPRVKRPCSRRFADGGLVDIPARPGGATEASLTATLDIDEGLILKRLEASPAFSRALVRQAQSNRKAMNTALRG
jgi:hypothetical protein